MRVGVGFENRVERFRAVQVTIANSHHFGGIFTMNEAAIDDGLLHCYAIESADFFRALGAAWTMVVRREPVPGVRAFRATRFELLTRSRHRISADGEPAGRTPAVVEILPRALHVIVPG